MLNCVRVDKSSLPPTANVYDLLKMAGIRPSISKIDKLAKMGGLKLNDQKVNPARLELKDYPRLGDCLYVVKSGKKEYFSIILE